ncbi:MAG: hypothetical protein LAT67_00485 [Balneolales bacterium]|nr:hypothetical protein [Balneolales bacterium]
MAQKTDSILIRVSRELSDRIQHVVDQRELKKSVLLRKAISHYLDHLERENPEVREVIRAIIIAKLDKIQKEYDQGRIIYFEKTIPINTSLNCSLCRDESGSEYIMYDILQKADENRLDAIDRHATILYEEWKLLPDSKRNHFMTDLHQDHVVFSMKPAMMED